MKQLRSRNRPVILKGMAGFLFTPQIRNKTFCIVMCYVFLSISICSPLPVFINPAYGLDASSSNFNVKLITPLQGGGAVSSTNNNANWTAIGEGGATIEALLSTLYRLVTGQLNLFGALPAVELQLKIIKDLRAKTEILGSFIPEATWQKDNDPYFYWEEDIEPPEAITGYSTSLDNPPDLVVDITEPNYQFDENSITSGKHTFFVLPYTSGKVWYENSLLSFEIWVDRDAPVINQLQPPPGLITSNNTIPVSCFLSDAHSGLDKISTTLVFNNQTIAFNYDPEKQLLNFKPQTALPEGKNTVLLKAFDTVGNYTVKGWEFIVDTQAPVGGILINGGDAVTYSAYVALNIDVQDAVSGIKNIYLSNDGIFDTELNLPLPYSPIISNWLLREPDVNGKKAVYVKFQDFAGNLSAAYKDEINLQLRTPDTRIISGPATITESLDADFIYEASKSGCLFSYKLDNTDWSTWQSLDKVYFSGLATGNHYFYVKSGFDLNGDGIITIDEEDATPSLWVWTVKPEGYLEKIRKRILFWRR